MRKNVLITGGTKGIGLATAKRYLAAGFNITVAARSANDWELYGEKGVRSIVFDFSNTSDIPELVREVGSIDVLINNAGMMYGCPYSDYTAEMRNKILAVNLDSQIELIKSYAPLMAEKGGGRIVNNASIAGQIGHPDIWYGVTKAGVINITKSFAKIFGPKRIVINCVSAGPVETDMLATIPIERQNAIRAAVFTGRFALPDEMASVFYWLGVESPEYVNGTCIDVNNGFFPR